MNEKTVLKCTNCKTYTLHERYSHDFWVYVECKMLRRIERQKMSWMKNVEENHRKNVKIVVKLKHGVSSVYGTVIDANNSFLVTKDQYGKIHFLNVKGIVRVSESWNNQGQKREEENRIVEPLDKGGHYG